MKEISLKQVEKFHKNYQKDKYNKIIENAVVNNGIDAVCLDNQIIRENSDIFNIELPKAKVYDQKKSGRCWCYAAINTIKYNIAENMNIPVTAVDLSINYLTFFDKLEKSNKIYENVIQSDKCDYQYLKDEEIMEFGEGGLHVYAKELIKKYGLVPSAYMKESHDSSDSNKLLLLLKEKIKSDIDKLIRLKKEKNDLSEIRKQKEKMLEENFVILSKVLGEPVTNFDLEYKDKEDKYIRIENMTPLTFAQKYLTISLDEFVTLCNIPRYNREMYKRYVRKYDGSIIGKTKNDYVNVPIDELAKIAIKQLKDNVPVAFICPTFKMWYRKDWILDSRIYNYDAIMPFNRLNKEAEFNYEDIQPNHAMTFVGVHVINNRPIRWKVENSWGDKDCKQYLTMNNTFFDDCVIEISVLKKYVSKKILKVFEQDPIEIKVDEW